MGVGLAVGAAVAYSELVLVRMNVPVAVRNGTSHSGTSAVVVCEMKFYFYDSSVGGWRATPTEGAFPLASHSRAILYAAAATKGHC